MFPYLRVRSSARSQIASRFLSLFSFFFSSDSPQSSISSSKSSSPMADEETSSRILEYLLRQPISDHIINTIIAALPTPSSPSPRLVKTILLRRLAGQLVSLPSETLDTLELIEQLDRDHNLVRCPPESLQIAYSAVAVDVTARFLRDEDAELGDFFDAVNRVWNWRVGDMESSEAKGLASARLKKERKLVEEAVVNEIKRVELMERETEEEAREAVMAYLKEALANLGPTSVEMAAAAVVGRDGGECEGGDGVRVPIRGTYVSNEDGRSMSESNHLTAPEVNREKPMEEEMHDAIEEPRVDIPTTSPVEPNLGIEDDSNLERMDEHQNPVDKEEVPSVEKVTKVPSARNNGCTEKNIVDDSIVQPCVTDHIRTESGQGEEDQTMLGRNVRVPYVDKGKVASNAEGTGAFSGRKRTRDALQGPSIMDRNPTARTHMWHDDSIESPENSPDPVDKHRVLRPNGRELPVTNAPWNREFLGRRKKKWWSADEEDALRKAVDKFGVGRWSLIKSTYPTIFQDRKSGDLKDKWRNMMK